MKTAALSPQAAAPTGYVQTLLRLLNSYGDAAFHSGMSTEKQCSVLEHSQKCSVLLAVMKMQNSIVDLESSVLI